MHFCKKQKQYTYQFALTKVCWHRNFYTLWFILLIFSSLYSALFSYFFSFGRKNRRFRTCTWQLKLTNCWRVWGIRMRISFHSHFFITIVYVLLILSPWFCVFFRNFAKLLTQIRATWHVSYRCATYNEVLWDFKYPNCNSLYLNFALIRKLNSIWFFLLYIFYIILFCTINFVLNVFRNGILKIFVFWCF